MPEPDRPLIVGSPIRPFAGIGILFHYNFGTITGSYKRPGGKLESDVGKVRAQGDQLCLTFKVLNNGEEQCFGVRSKAGGQFVFTAAGGLVEACQVSQM